MDFLRLVAMVLGVSLLTWTRWGTFLPAVECRAWGMGQGFNQANLMARALARRLGVEVSYKLEAVQRIRDQVHLSGVERRENVHGAFRPSGPVSGRVLLGDDVFTTGATSSAAAGALRKAGANEVHTVRSAGCSRARGDAMKPTEERSGMDILVKGRNLSVTEALDRYASEKVKKVEKFFDEGRSDARAEVELTHERNRAVSEPEVAEATLFINGTVLKAKQATADMYASIDGMVDKLERQVRRYRGRQLDRWQGQRERVMPEPVLAEDEGDLETRIVRTKQFQMKPMGAEEAALQMELLDHDFYVFTSADTGDINVVYRRRDGDYGLIEPAR